MTFQADASETGQWRLDWPTSSGKRDGGGVLKSVAEDFRVDEVFDPGEEQGGEHLYLRLEKTGDNTEYVARQLARLADCRPFDVGFCGLKDRNAVTRQWFSLYRPGMADEDEALMTRIAESWKLLGHQRMPRKLRRGEHTGNDFDIVLRDVRGDRDAIDSALARVASQGCPNYFGPQRFGHSGANLDHAINMDPSAPLTPKRKSGKKSRGRRSGSGSADVKNVLYFSAARSWLFNEVLAHRVEAGNWTEQIPGEPAADVTGPMWGDGGTLAELAQGELERRVVAGHPEVERVFSQTRMKPERRNLVLIPEFLRWSWLDDSALELQFRLEPGQYATTLLNDVFEIEVNGENRADSIIQ